jgi:hypothetical protein
LLVLGLPVTALITATPLPARNREEPDRKIELFSDFLRDGLFAAGPQIESNLFDAGASTASWSGASIEPVAELLAD